MGEKKTKQKKKLWSYKSNGDDDDDGDIGFPLKKIYMNLDRSEKI